MKFERKSAQVIGERHRLLIAAAVAAVVGRRFRIVRQRIVIRPKAARQEERHETANHD
jgi:hypothetical protein